MVLPDFFWPENGYLKYSRGLQPPSPASYVYVPLSLFF